MMMMMTAMKRMRQRQKKKEKQEEWNQADDHEWSRELEVVGGGAGWKEVASTEPRPYQIPDHSEKEPEDMMGGNGTGHGKGKGRKGKKNKSSRKKERSRWERWRSRRRWVHVDETDKGKEKQSNQPADLKEHFKICWLLRDDVTREGGDIAHLSFFFRCNIDFFTQIRAIAVNIQVTPYRRDAILNKSTTKTRGRMITMMADSSCEDFEFMWFVMMMMMMMRRRRRRQGTRRWKKNSDAERQRITS